MPRRPPCTHVGVLWLGDQDSPKALLFGRLRAVEVLQQVVFLEVECKRAGGAVDLDPQRVLAAEGKPGGLEHPRCAVGEPRREQGGIVDRDVAPWNLRANVSVTTQSRALTAQRP